MSYNRPNREVDHQPGGRRIKVSADGAGLVSRAGVALLRELTVDTGLADGWTDALLDTYKAFPTAHLPGRVLADLAVMIADGGGRAGVPRALGRLGAPSQPRRA